MRATVLHAKGDCRLFGPAFLVDDLESARRELAAAGAPVVPDDTLPGVRRFYTADPFGNRIELIQRGDGFSE